MTNDIDYKTEEEFNNYIQNITKDVSYLKLYFNNSSQNYIYSNKLSKDGTIDLIGDLFLGFYNNSVNSINIKLMGNDTIISTYTIPPYEFMYAIDNVMFISMINTVFYRYKVDYNNFLIPIYCNIIHHQLRILLNSKGCYLNYNDGFIIFNQGFFYKGKLKNSKDVKLNKMIKIDGKLKNLKKTQIIFNGEKHPLFNYFIIKKITSLFFLLTNARTFLL